MLIQSWLQCVEGLFGSTRPNKRRLRANPPVSSEVQVLEGRQLMTAVNPGFFGNGHSSPESATLIQHGQSMGGNITFGGETQWYRFTAVAGQTYRVETTLESLPDSTLTILASDGTTAVAFNDDHGGTRASQIMWNAPSDGTFYIKAAAYDAEQVGTFTFTCAIANPPYVVGPVRPIGVGDDHSNSSVAATMLQTGQSIQGNLETGGDTDWFRFDLVGGQTYRLATTLGTLADSTLTLYGSNGATILDYNDDDGGQTSSQLTITPTVSGAYFAQVGAYAGDQTGTYSLGLTATQNLVGQWWMSGYYPARIQQIGTGLRFVNERGEASDGRMSDSTHVVATGWGNLVGTIVTTSSGIEIRWDNNTTWTQQRQQAPNLGGSWLMRGRQPTSINQNSNNQLTFINERGERANGIFLNSSRVVAYGWNGLQGSIIRSGNNMTIRWDNGTYWTFYSRSPWMR